MHWIEEAADHLKDNLYVVSVILLVTFHTFVTSVGKEQVFVTNKYSYQKLHAVLCVVLFLELC
jgi:hypothetical protein